MTIDEARACLADYTADPVFRWVELVGDKEVVEYYHASIASDDGTDFCVGLDDYDGFEEAYRTVDAYHQGIGLRRRAQHHIRHFHADECELGNNCLGVRYWHRYDFEPIPS